MPTTVQLSPAELDLVNQLSQAAQSVQSQLNTAIAMALASRGVKDYQITGAENGSITYLNAEEKAAQAQPPAAPATS